MNAYDSPEATAAMMERIHTNLPKIMASKKIIKSTVSTYYQKIKAVTECYMLLQGDPHAQKRLILELEASATQHELDNPPVDTK